jgi:enterochelin esterase-like enzyme
MKRSLTKKITCFTLVTAMALSAVNVIGTRTAAGKKASLAKKNMTVKIGSKISIVIKNKNKKAKYTFSSSDKTIATVTKKGVMTGKKKGNAKITVKETLKNKTRKLGVIKVKVILSKNTGETSVPTASTAAQNPTTNAPSSGSAATTADNKTKSPQPGQEGETSKATEVPKASSAPKATTTPLPTPKASVAPYEGRPTPAPIDPDSITPPSDFNKKKNGVTYGSKEDIYYQSGVTGTKRHAIVLTPPNYDPDRKYPVLYLCHGGNGDENDWFDGNPDLIYGNLLDANEAVSMIMVLVNCRARANDGPNPSDSLSDAHMKAWTDFLYELQDDLMPYMSNNYPILTGRDNTAIAGFSMGGRESLYIGFKIPDKISYIGAFSPAFGIFEYTNFGYHENGYFTEDTFTLPDEYMNNTTCMIMNGANDSMVRDEPEKYHNVLVENGVNHYYYTIPGDHNMEVWRNGLYNFLKIVFK